MTGEAAVISAATVTETLIAAARRGYRSEMEAFFGAWPLTVQAVDIEFARRAAAAYERWGKGVHPAALNYGDTFSYAVAEMHSCSLLYVGDDFAQTEIRSALADA